MQAGTRALVVDDDAVAQEIAIRALAQIGVKCDAAFGGWQARSYCDANRYDAVVTDLQMPNGNGHALCVELLQQPDPPLIVVVTSINDPRLTRDLLVRGVDDVMFKPLDGQLLATKIEALLARRAAADRPGNSRGAVGDSIPRDVELGISTAPVRRLSAAELEGKVAILAHLLPISPVASEVASLTSSDDADAHSIAETIKRDAALAAELLKLANSPFYDPSNQTLVDVEKAVVRIGTKRIGELAMAMAALDGLTQSRLPWMNVGLAWRGSVAAGIAIDRLCERTELATNNSGLFLSALMHDLGRIVLGSVYTEEYKAMLAACEKSGTSLLDQEVRVFPARHTDVMARLLAMWKVAPTVYQPLKHLADSYFQLEQISEPLRSKAELVKIAVLIGQLAVGNWEPWKLVEIPPVSVLARLDLTGIEEVLEQTKIDLQAVIQSQKGGAAKRLAPSAPRRSRPAPRVAYLRVGSTRFDFVQEIIASLGVELVPCAPEDLEIHDHAIISCLGTPAERLAEFLPQRSAGQRRLIVTDAHRAAEYAPLGTPLALPASCAVVRATCLGWADGDCEAFVPATAEMAGAH
ncbi:MAG TPA: HDOD domain-containing protein [Pirellulales bacterium]|jgi:HD-like signal output (HDOD) protein/CheY-like chemotaxis protein|nr:HDOD domain-containing protein [Pirellulales bacterium]